MAPSSFLLQAGVIAAAALSASAAAVPTIPEHLYTRDHQYAGSTFMDNFNFFTEPDPTKGFVHYKSMADAKRLGLAKTMGNGATYLGVDTTNKYMNFNTYGRPSTRLESKKIYNGGLFIADIAHMPTGAGTWPAYWTVGHKSWPGDGEIDILENINEQTVNLATLHTKEDCLIDASAQGGTVKTSHCSNDYTDYWSQWQNQGCSVFMKEPNNYGTAFNRAGGALYAMDWQEEHIKIWMLTRGTAAATNALSANPDPSSWPKPSFTTEKGTCNISKLFKDHTLVINTSFCGDYAGQDIQWQQTSIYASDPVKYAKCHDYVGAHPEAFVEAYWLINSINVYKRSKNPSYVPPTSTISSSPVSSTTMASSTTDVSSTVSTSSSASATPALPAGLITSPDGSCGNKYSCDGYLSLTGYSCCNKFGRCGSSADDCGTGCKSTHSTPGRCDGTAPSSSTTRTAPAPTPNPGGLITSPDGSCGNKYTCNQFAGLAYACCNQYGRCGNTAADCASGCKDSHSTPGKCNTPKPSTTTSIPVPSSTLVTSPDGSCGNKYTCNGFNGLTYACCNQYGRCGNTAADCASGCKDSHSTPGKCNTPKPSTTTSIPVPSSTLVTSPDGSCGNKYTCNGFNGLTYACCNQFGRCGNSAADCSSGCKTTHSTPGKCGAAAPAPSSTLATSVKPSATASLYKTSPDGSCGNLYSCSGFASPLGYSCCNRYGRCGSTAADCGVGSGCKVSHSTPGKCGVAAPATPVTAPPAKAGLVKSPNGSCGNSYTCAGYASPLGYSCCSQYGYCGTTSDHCGTGCKKGYGACF